MQTHKPIFHGERPSPVPGITRAAVWMLAVLVAFAEANAQAPAGEGARENGQQSLVANSDARTANTEPEDPPAGDSDLPVVSMFPRVKDTRFWLSGQGNAIFQASLPFPAAYSGKNSLGPGYQKGISRVFTLYSGVRLNNATELLADVEDASGEGLSNALGLAGITNLDVVRIPGQGSPLSTAPYLARGMIHFVYALSKDKIESERTPLSLFDELPRRRLELRFGKFSLADFLDQNAVGSDSHFQFANWTVDQNGAWDFAADTRGYTVGLLADYEDRNWGFRFGEALMPKVANGIDLVWKPWQAHAENWQLELRRGLIRKKTGAIRLLGYTNAANMGIYREAVVQFERGLVPRPEITNHPWRITRKYGLGINLEQNLDRYLTAFGRFGWNNDTTESFAFTEVGQTVALGVRANGALWHRGYDRAGVAVASNGLSKDHQAYLALGGYGFLLGDGSLNYGRENILESYYTLHVWRGIYVAPGVQHIQDPGYNRDRGPVLVPSLRLHVEF